MEVAKENMEETVEMTKEATETPNIKEPLVLKGNPNEYVYKPGDKVEVEGQLLPELKNLLTQLISSETVSGNYFQFKYFKEDGTHVKTPTKAALDSKELKKELDWEATIFDQEQSHFLTQKGIGYARLLAHVERLHFLNIQSGKSVHYTELQETPPSNQ